MDILMFGIFYVALMGIETLIEKKFGKAYGLQFCFLIVLVCIVALAIRNF